MIRVRLSLQYPALEAGVRTLLGGDPGIAVMSDGEDMQRSERPNAADVHIMTSAAFLRLTKRQPEEEGHAGIVILGAEGFDVGRLWSQGLPWGVLPLDVSSEELSAAVRAVAAGLVVGASSLLRESGESHLTPGPLTEREVEILAMLCRGLANKQVAAELGISEHTVKFHVSSIYTKLNVANRTEAVREGLRNGWITL